MTLGFQIAIALGAAGAIALVLRTGLLERALVLRAVVVIVSAGLFVVAALKVDDMRDFFDDQGEIMRSISQREVDLQGGVAIGVDVNFVDWARERMAPGDTFYVLTDRRTKERPESRRQWISYQLAPHILVDDPEDADWLVAHGVRPKRVEEWTLFGVPLSYAPRYSVAKRRDAS